VNRKQQAAAKESLQTSYKHHVWDSGLKLECKSLRLAFELEAHLLIIQQQRWFRKDKIETHLSLIPIGIGKEHKMLTTFINKQ
jgi:hypothetical protein